MPDKHSLLQRYWGHNSFRPLQEEIIDSVLVGNDTLVLLPTGGGKSVCYQLPALMMEGLCLVVSPLIALMKDQVEQLRERHLKAACLVSGMSSTESAAALSGALSGSLKFLYVSPERLRQRSFIEHFRQMKVSLIAVDEAHCVSQWGYDFRPPYLQIADIRQYQPSTPLIALTASATPEVVDDIELRLKMHHCHRFQASFERKNLTYAVAYDEDKDSRLLRLIRSLGGSGIVYTSRRRTTRQVAERLQREGITASYYHAGLDGPERDYRQRLWMSNECQVMVATSAFGMGIDKPDVHFVIHLDAPSSLEAYFQEAGRAGRNGHPAYAVLLCSGNDSLRLERDFDSDFPSVKIIRNVYRALCNYYQLPLGSGEGSIFDFDLDRIRDTYDLSINAFYSACRFLEREGLIALPDNELAFSTLYIPLSREELYRFQVDNLRLGDLLQTLIRLYPGILSSAVSIDERKIAARVFATQEEVAMMLIRLKEMHIVEYRQRTDKPQIIFTSARINERDIYLGEENYATLKEAAARRLVAMQHYLTCDTVCRSRQLLAYFGETEGVEDCGHCDVCRHRVHDSAQTQDSIQEAILRLLKGNRLSPHDLRRLLEDEGLDNSGDAIRDLMDRGVIYLDENLLLSIS